jgi:hypothetical protein
VYAGAQRERIVRLCGDADSLGAMPVHAFADMLANND